MHELEWLRNNVVVPGLWTPTQFDAWVRSNPPNTSLLEHLVALGVLESVAAQTLAAAIKGYLSLDPAAVRSFVARTDPGLEVPSPPPSPSPSVAKPQPTGRTGRHQVIPRQGIPAGNGALRAAVDAAITPPPDVAQPDKFREATDRGLREVMAEVQRWVDTAWLNPGGFPEALRRLEGTAGPSRLCLRTDRYQGGGCRALTVATIVDQDGMLRSLTLVVLPASRCLAPILGVDLIAFGTGISLAAVDLSPTDRDSWTQHAAPVLDQLHSATEGHVTPRKWPTFARDVFSPKAMIAGVRRGHEAVVLAGVAQCITEAVPLYRDVAGRALTPEHSNDDGVRRWCQAELANRREHDALSRIFGETVAEAYLDALFGEMAAAA